MTKGVYERTPEHLAHQSRVQKSRPPEKQGGWKAPLSAEHRAKISAGRKEKLTPEGREAITRSNRERTLKPVSEETRVKMSESRKGYRHSEVTKGKISKGNSGKIMSPESRVKMSTAKQKYFADRAASGSPPRRPKKITYLTHGDFLRDRDGDLCQLCLLPIDFSLPVLHRQARSVDHIMPHHAGGVDVIDNCWLAHRACNSSKGVRFSGRPDGTTDIRRMP